LGRPYSYTFSTPLRAAAEKVWAHASTFAGVNQELWPWACMTYPATVPRLTPKTVPLGRTAFRSWILLFGFIPVDYDDFTLVKLEPERGFSEVSRLFSVRQWTHCRTLQQTDGGCIVTDEITLSPRLPGTDWLLAVVYRLMFAWRHRRLRQLFGAGTATSRSLS
jgi:ligand-binding SRPBCC domain-containing protein